MVLVLALSLSAFAGDVGSLTADAGWKPLADRNSDIGKVSVSVKHIDGVPCLRGETMAEASVDALLDVARDITSASEWSSAGVTKAKVLAKGDRWLEYMQFLDVPNWTMSVDRFWVVRGAWKRSADGGVVFSWQRIGDDRYNDTRLEVLKAAPTALELPVNFGAWSFRPDQAGTRVRYEICSDIGGTVPASVQRWVASGSLPTTVADLVTEARRRM